MRLETKFKLSASSNAGAVCADQVCSVCVQCALILRSGRRKPERPVLDPPGGRFAVHDSAAVRTELDPLTVATYIGAVESRRRLSLPLEWEHVPERSLGPA
jgi:hypothetical protein